MKHLKFHSFIAISLIAISLITCVCVTSFTCVYGDFKRDCDTISQVADTINTNEEKLSEIELKSLEPNAENMLMVCKYYGIKNPKIVTSQAILESANFNSNVFKRKNNPFGLYNSKKKTYYSFDHWTSSVKGYKNMIEYKYKGGNYYVFLQKIGYAEDKDYISKVKKIHNNLYM